MIDVENSVLQAIGTAIGTSATLVNEPVEAPAQYPCVSVVEADNVICVETIDSDGEENHVDVVYEINVYSNDATNRTGQAKGIFLDIDDVMSNLGFLRIAKNPISSSVPAFYQIMAKYSARVSKNNEIYKIDKI